VTKTFIIADEPVTWDDPAEDSVVVVVGVAGHSIRLLREAYTLLGITPVALPGVPEPLDATPVPNMEEVARQMIEALPEPEPPPRNRAERRRRERDRRLYR